MKLIAIWSNKGGVGKTTMSINLSSALAALRHRVAVVDMDEQKSAALVKEMAGDDLQFDIYTSLDEIENSGKIDDYDFIVVDFPPGGGTIEILEDFAPDLILVPLTPNLLSEHALVRGQERMSDFLRERVAIFVNMMDYRKKAQKEMVDLLLEDHGEFPIIRNLTALENTALLGQGVFQMKGRVSGLDEAKDELWNLAEFAISKLNAA